MTLRRPSWSQSCLCQLSSSLRHARQGQIKASRWAETVPRAVEQRRRLASVAPNEPLIPSQDREHQGVVAQPQHEYGSRPAVLSRLLFAIRNRDTSATTASFLEWTDILGDPTAPKHASLVSQCLSLTSPVISEIIRSMDPILQPTLDTAHGLNITQGQAQYINTERIMDSFGVRLHHRKVLKGMLTIMVLRERARYSLRPADFNTFLRCAGAAVDYRSSAIIFGNMAKHGLVGHRTDQTWLEFLKARFMMEPTYYQFDRARIAVDPRDQIKHLDLVDGHQEMIRRMDRVRLSTNAFMRQPWNRRRDEPGEDIRRLLRRSGETLKLTLSDVEATSDPVEKTEDSAVDIELDELGEEKEPPAPEMVYQDYRGFWRHWLRHRSYPNEMSEEMVCAALVGFSRPNDRRAILDILASTYKIEVDEESHTVGGGTRLQQYSTLYPTSRLLNAIVESFGSMSEISLAMQLVDYISQRYSVPITPEVWSNLLNWSYLSASKKNQRLRRMYGDGEQTRVDTQDVIHVWNVMTSEPYNIQPTFDDLDIHIKTLIITRRHNEAETLIRESAMPFYDSLVENFQTCLFDEALLTDAALQSSSSPAVSQAAQRRREAETRKDYVFNRMAIWFDDMLRILSKSRSLRNSEATTVNVPNLVRDFPSFFLTGVRYRTRTGHVSLEIRDPATAMRWSHRGRVARDALRTKMGTVDVHPASVDEQGAPRRLFDEETGRWYENPEFEWPTNRGMKVVEKRKVPRARAQSLPPLPDAHFKAGGKKWWDMIRYQLTM